MQCQLRPRLRPPASIFQESKARRLMRRKVVLQVLSMDELLFDLKTPNYIGRLKKMLAEAKGVRVVQVPYS